VCGDLLAFLNSFLILVQSLRSEFKEETKKYLRSKDIFLKIYGSYHLAEHEHRIMASIGEANPLSFRVPKFHKLIRSATTGRTIGIMELVKEQPLELFIYRFILFRDVRGINVFYRFGEALHELHDLNFKAPVNNNIPCSKQDLLNEMRKYVKTLNHLGVIDSSVLRFIKEEQNIDNRIMRVVDLYGETYFPHIKVSNGEFVFLDMEDSCHGAAYHDLATFNVSLYTSLLIPNHFMSRLGELRQAFLNGYFGEKIPIKSIKMAELYVLLREMNKLCNNQIYYTEIFRRRLLRSLKLRRFQWLVNNFILSNA